MNAALDPWMTDLAHVAKDVCQTLKLDQEGVQAEDCFLMLHHTDVLLPILAYLKHDPHHHYQQFIDLCGVDFPDRPQRFQVVYHLLSLTHNKRIRLKLLTDEHSAVPSVTTVFPGAGWWEREAYDMYGITFSDHPDLRRILTDYGFEGHPLRKDFPLTGFTQVRYDAQHQTVVTEPVHLAQPYRDFDYVGPWKGPLFPKGGHYD